ncbi:DnaD domain-containing protein [Bacillus safensis]|uniref:DNA replication protein DnaD n=1 Tax=Bacillus safensis TaxID=561879 RepID=A0A0M2EDD2_BACIA|nr:MULTISPECIES: DnaD domain-containing protein [Bacillus]PNU24439.1 DnaD domain protein [Bacillus stratosphericus]APT47720.1 DNA replication protein DnaD [Bacillus safensis]AYJ89291.1 DnaD domain protein [Bacillus safensis]KAB3541632.1 DnaD domain-containing protein [Bacillus safensis]KAB3546875.1 DnaD domain-containing protein [Bacillus safensis]
MNRQQFINMQQMGSTSLPNLLIAHYEQLGLNESQMMVMLKIKMNEEQGVFFQTFEELSQGMTISAEECAYMVQHLIQKGFISIQPFEDRSGIQHDRYSVEPLWGVLYDFLETKQAKEVQKQQVQAEKSLYALFEDEFGRPLSPLEGETLSIWMDQDHHDAEMIRLALREAVLSGKLNFRYIDRILFEWKKKGLKTAKEAKEHSQHFRSQQKTPPSNEETSTYKRQVPFYNWLEQ